jgi:hypothetical protein
MAFQGKHPRRSKTVINNQTMEQVENFNSLGCYLSYNYDDDLQNKLFKFQHIYAKLQSELSQTKPGRIHN